MLSCSIASSRLPQMPCGLGSCCMSMAISPPTTSTTCTSSGSKLQSLVTCRSTRTPQWQTFAPWTADSKLTASLSTSFQLTAPQACYDSCLLTCQRSKPCCLHWTGGCHHMPSRRAKVQSRASHLMSCKQLSSCLVGARSQAQMACLMSSTPNYGRCSAQSCWQSCKKPSRLSMVSACQPPWLKGSSPCCTKARVQRPCWTATAPSPSSTAITSC